MSIVRKDLCHLNKIGNEKLKSLMEYDGTPLVGILSHHIINQHSCVLGKQAEFKHILVIGRFKGIEETEWAGVTVKVEIPNVDVYPNPLRNGSPLFVEISVGSDDLYELSPEIFTAITHNIDKIFVDENDDAYIEGEETNGVFVLIGNYKKYKGKSFKKGKEVNGVFSTEEDAKKMGDMLKDYGRLNDIEYTDYQIHNFLVL